MRRVGYLVLTVGLMILWSGSPAGAGGGGHCNPSTAESDAPGTTVYMASSCFTPTTLRVAAGTEVKFVNKDPYQHRVTGTGNRWGSTKLLEQGEFFTTTFRREGVYAYACNLHWGMNGAVVVGDSESNVALPAKVTSETSPSPIGIKKVSVVRPSPARRGIQLEWALLSFWLVGIAAFAGFKVVVGAEKPVSRLIKVATGRRAR
jgi:plastocyanin